MTDSPEYTSPKHNHVRKIAELGLTPEQLANLQVLHESGCAIYRGGYCNCDPLLRESRPLPHKKERTTRR